MGGANLGLSPTCYCLLFFAAYLNMQEKFFIQYSGVVSFLSVYFCKLFNFQIDCLGSAVRTNNSPALGPGSNLCRAKIFYDFINIR